MPHQIHNQEWVIIAFVLKIVDQFLDSGSKTIQRIGGFFGFEFIVDPRWRFILEFLHPILVGKQVLSDRERSLGYGLAEFDPIRLPLATIVVGVRSWVKWRHLRMLDFG